LVNTDKKYSRIIYFCCEVHTHHFLLNSSKIGDFADNIYRIELEIKDIPDNIQLGLLHTWSYPSKLTVKAG